MNTVVWGQLVGISIGVAAILGAAVGLWKVGKALWVGARRVARLLDDWAGEDPRPGLPQGRPGLLARIDSIEQRLFTLPTREEVAELRERIAAVEEQLKPNGGNSFRDAVDKAIDNRPRVESGGLGFSAELAPEAG